MNNKGFAITGILYTLLILFLLIIGSFLNVIRSKNNYLEKSVLAKENKYVGNSVTNNDLSVAEYTGKYVYTNGSIECYAYLSEGDLIDPNSLKFSNSECNNDTVKSSLSLSSVFSFEESD